MENKKKLVIFGAGGYGREMLFLVSDINASNNYCYDILGFIDDTPALQNKVINKFPVLGDSSWLMNYNDEINVVIALGSSQSRKIVYERLSQNQNILFPNIIATGAKYSEEVSFGKGCIIGNYTILSTNISIGDFVLIGNLCDIGHDVKIGDFVTIFGCACLCGYVEIGSFSEIGVGADIIPKKKIGENSVVGAGAVVMRNVPANCTVYGNPAKKLV